MDTKYNHKLVAHIANTSIFGIVSSNIIGILLVNYMLLSIVATSHIIFWSVLSIIVLFIRLFTTHRILNTDDDSYDTFYLRITVLLLFINALIYAYITYCAIAYQADISDAFIIAILIISLVAGSVSTLSSVFPLFATFAITSFGFLILNFAFLELKSSYILLILFFIFSIFFTVSTYKVSLLLEKHILLEEEHLISKNNLAKLNQTLEQRIEKEIEKNTQHLQILQQQSKMAQMEEVLGAIAHQWRQPLNVISTGIQNLKYDYQDGYLNEEKFVKDFIDKQKKTINSMSQTIDDFRNFFRVGTVQKTFNIKKSIESVLNIVSAQLKEQNINILLEGDGFEFYGLENEYQQVILDIISNAKDEFIGNKIKNPIIHIIIKDNSISIEDNAGGIQKESIERIFEPYYTTKEQGKGTGMGLYMSKMMIEDNMGGKLSVQNFINGAKFIITFNNSLTKEENNE